MTYGIRRLGKMRLLLHEILEIKLGRSCYFSEILEAFTEKSASAGRPRDCYYH